MLAKIIICSVQTLRNVQLTPDLLGANFLLPTQRRRMVPIWRQDVINQGKVADLLRNVGNLIPMKIHEVFEAAGETLASLER